MTSAPITTNDLALRAQNEKLSLREKIGYGLGDAGGIDAEAAGCILDEARGDEVLSVGEDGGPGELSRLGG